VTPEALIAHLQLASHPEGGWFRRTHTAPQRLGSGDDERAAMSAIYYLLTRQSPVGHLHRNRSDILHCWQLGSPLRYWLLSPVGELRQVMLGPDLEAGQQLQLLVPGGWWKGTELVAGEFGLLTEAVCPGFDPRDHEFAEAEALRAAWPAHWPLLAHLCRGR
jgi:predicted cupin superfamily sugar epimerase